MGSQILLKTNANMPKMWKVDQREEIFKAQDEVRDNSQEGAKAFQADHDVVVWSSFFPCPEHEEGSTLAKADSHRSCTVLFSSVQGNRDHRQCHDYEEYRDQRCD